jgi:heterotetrameric sarcosine oxidase gamma subunit
MEGASVGKSVEITERSGLALATLMLRKDSAVTALGSALAMIPPEQPLVAGEGALKLIGTGPGVWLAVDETDDPDWFDGLRQTLAGIASASDQTAGYTVFRLQGVGAGDLLQKGAFIDLDPAVFVVGSSAVTVIAHIGVILWKVDDRPTFDVAVFRSLSGSFSDWIAANIDGHSPS